MGWKNWPYWVRGGGIAVLYVILYFLVQNITQLNKVILIVFFPLLIIYFLIFAVVITYSGGVLIDSTQVDLQQVNTLGAIILNVLLFIVFFILGALIGFIIGKIKSRKQGESNTKRW